MMAIQEADMNGEIRKWGNSLAVRVPRDVARTLGLHAGTPVTLDLVDGTLVVRPRTARTLDELLAGVTPEAVGGELDWGDPQGGEVW
jgi:antitoxin MazE